MRSKEYRSANREKEQARSAKYRQDNKEAIRANAAEYRARPEVIARSAEYHLHYYAANKDSIRARTAEYAKARRDQYNEYTRQWLSRNPDKNAAKAAKRRATKLAQTPADADPNAIAIFYTLAKLLEKHTGVKYHVDHIIPLSQGGLHHQDNLQVLRWDYNLAKGGQYDPRLDLNSR